MALRVLVIDDSAYNRQIISEVLNSHPDITVVGKAEDGEQGFIQTTALKPDLITLDLEMPRMDGFTFLRLVMSRMPTPVIVVSSHSRKQEVFQALELGALDFVAKPDRYFSPDTQRLKEEIISKALAVRALQVVPFAKRGGTTARDAKPRRGSEPTVPVRIESGKLVGVERIVLLGASTGGPPALQSLFKTLDALEGTAYLVAQHMPERFTRAFADRLNRNCRLNIREATDGDIVQGGSVYVAAGGSHLEVVQSMDNAYMLRLKRVGEADRYIPSIDRLFVAASRLSGVELLAVVLTGMGSDGSEGIRAIRRVGGRTIAESQDSAIVFGMPKEAIDTECVDEVLPMETIIERVQAFGEGAFAGESHNSSDSGT